MKGVLILSLMMMFTGVSFAQKSDTKTVKIKTSAECGMCKTRIEEALNYMKGVKYAELDVLSKVVTVKYSSGKTTSNEIRKKIAATGYDADDVKANKQAVLELPKCCQPNGMK